MELLEEKKLFMAFKHSSATPTTRTKLVFDNPAYVDKPGQSPASKADRPSRMVVDAINIIEPGPEVFKQKQADAQLSKDIVRYIKQVKESIIPISTDNQVEVAQQPRPAP